MSRPSRRSWRCSGLYAEIANDAMDGILAETERQSPDQLQLCFCYMMDLLGIRDREDAAGHIFTRYPV